MVSQRGSEPLEIAGAERDRSAPRDPIGPVGEADETLALRAFE